MMAYGTPWFELWVKIKSIFLFSKQIHSDLNIYVHKKRMCTRIMYVECIFFFVNKAFLPVGMHTT